MDRMHENSETSLTFMDSNKEKSNLNTSLIQIDMNPSSELKENLGQSVVAINI